MIGQNVNTTGKFFGEFHGDVMAAMVQKGIYQSIDVYDFQELCEVQATQPSEGHTLLHVSVMRNLNSFLTYVRAFLQPLKVLSLAWKWIIAQVFWHYQRVQWWVDGAPCKSIARRVNMIRRY